jgi:hypothetical protein
MAGRWILLDPLEASINDPQSFNRCLYAANDGASLIDPVGLKPGRNASDIG